MHALVFGGGDVDETAGDTETGVVYQQSQIRQDFQSFLDCGNAFVGREIGCKHINGPTEIAKFGCNRVQSLEPSRYQQEIVAISREPASEGYADTRGSTGDHGSFGHRKRALLNKRSAL